MAIVRAVKSGNWSDPTVWNTGALPTAADDVYSNTFTVTIDTSPTVLSISNAAATGVTAGGFFQPNNGITLTCTGAGVVAGAAHCFISSLTAGQSCTVAANATGGTANNSDAIRNTGAGTLSVVGNLTGGTNASQGNGCGANNTSTGTLNVTGNATGGTGSNGQIVFGAHGIRNESTGTINLTGNATGGSGSGSVGVINISTGTIAVTGSITGGSSSNNNNYGAWQQSTGTLTHVGTAQASTVINAIGGLQITQVTVLTGPLICSNPSDASAGINPVICARWFPADNALTTFRYEMRGQTASSSPAVRPTRNLYLTDAYAAGYPSTSNVRSGTTYGPAGSTVGTLAVPPAGSVALGVPVDNTTGTAFINQNDISTALVTAISNNNSVVAISTALASASAVTLNQQTSSLNTPGSIGERLKLASTVATTAQQLSDALSNE